MTTEIVTTESVSRQEVLMKNFKIIKEKLTNISSNKNVDGGSANTNYLATQKVNGGNA
jgi:hypothetical protein